MTETDIKYKGFWALNYKQLYYMGLSIGVLAIVGFNPVALPRWLDILGACASGSLFTSSLNEIRDNYRKQLEVWKGD